MFMKIVHWSAGLGSGHLIVIVGMGGGAFANESRPQGRAFDQFFPMPGVCPGGCSRLELTRSPDPNSEQKRHFSIPY